MLPPQNLFLIFELKMANFGAFWELILLRLNCLYYTQACQPIDFGLSKLLLHQKCQNVGGLLHDCLPGLKSGGHVPLVTPVDTPSSCTAQYNTIKYRRPTIKQLYIHLLFTVMQQNKQQERKKQQQQFNYKHHMAHRPYRRALAEGSRDALYQLKSCEVLQLGGKSIGSVVCPSVRPYFNSFESTDL